MVADASLTVVFANREAETCFAGSELAGRDLPGILHESSDTFDADDFRSTLLRQGTYSGEISLAKEGSRSVRLGVSCAGIPDGPSGTVSAYVLIAAMIGDSADIDQNVVQLDRMLKRGEMACEIAHEINNHLTILMGNVELIPLLLESKDTDKLFHKLSLMKATLEKITAFSESLVDYGEPRPSFEPADLNRIVIEAVDFLTPQNRFDSVEIKLDLSPQLPPVMGDSGQLQQVIVNLLHNAADELSAGEIAEAEIVIRTAVSREGEGDFAIVSVCDNGRGISDELISKLFQARVTTKETGNGFGLLACKRIIDLHGGEISFDTAAERGTCFRLTLPYS
jgi:signal transduction histidine kinase